MPIVSFLNQKGGVGKTTLCVNIARDFKLRGRKTLLVDTDPQGSALDWHARSDGELMDMVCLSKPTLNKDVPKFTEMYDWIFIDGIGKIDEMASSAIACSDVVLIPVHPSPYDIWSTKKIIELVRARQIIAFDQPKASFIVSMQISNTNLSKDVKSQLEEYGLSVLNGRTCTRVAYAECLDKGLTIHEWNDQKALSEIKQLALEIEDIANGVT